MVRPKSLLGLKYVEITRGKSDEGFDDGGDDAAGGVDAAAGRVRRAGRHVRRADPPGADGQPRRLRHRASPAAARRSTRRSARSGRCCATSSRWRGCSATRETGLERTIQALGPHGRARGARRRAAGRAVRRTSTRTFAALARGDAGDPGVDRARARRRSTRRSSPSRSSGRSWPTRERLMRRARARRALAAHRRADAGGRVPHRPAHAAGARSSSTAGCSKVLAVAAGLRRGPAGQPRRRGPHRGHRRAAPDAGVRRAGADDVQLPGAVVPQRLLAAQRGRRARHLAALHHHRHAAGPEQRGQPVVELRQRPDRVQLPARQPVPEHRVAGAAQGVRGRPTSRT